MAYKRGRPGNPAVRSAANVGPNYPEDRFRNPFNAGIETGEYGSETEKTMCSPSETTFDGAGIELHHEYDKYWEGK